MSLLLLLLLLIATRNGPTFDSGHSTRSRTGGVIATRIILGLLHQDVWRRRRRWRARTGGHHQSALVQLLFLLEAPDNIDQMIQIEFPILAGRIRWNASCLADVSRRLVVCFNAAAFTFLGRLLHPFSAVHRVVDGRRDDGGGSRGRHGRRGSVRRHQTRTRFHRKMIGTLGRMIDRMKEITQVDAHRMRTSRVSVLVFHAARAVPAFHRRQALVAHPTAGVHRRRSGRRLRRYVRMKVLSSHVHFSTGRTAPARHSSVSFLIILDVVLDWIAALDVNSSAQSDPMTVAISRSQRGFIAITSGIQIAIGSCRS